MCKITINKLINGFQDTHKRPVFKKVYKGRKIIVLAPHPDDEIIGPGGTLLKNIKCGNQIHIVFITDGSKGRTKNQSKEEITAIRMNEAIQVCKQLPATYSFLACADGNYVPERKKIDLLAQLIKDINPSDIFLPHLNDLHRDHFMTNLLFYQAICNGRETKQTIWEYEVWSPLIPNTVINITDEYKEKSELLEIYQSQLQLINYGQMMEGLNKYRVSTVPIRGITHMEAFYCSSVKKYKRKLKVLFHNKLK